MKPTRFHNFSPKRGRKIIQCRFARIANISKSGFDKRKYLANGGLEPSFSVVEAEQRQFWADEVTIPKSPYRLKRKFEQQVPCNHRFWFIDSLSKKSGHNLASRDIQRLLKKNRVDEVVQIRRMTPLQQSLEFGRQKFLKLKARNIALTRRRIGI
jgi:hypothetical protein